MSENNTKPPFNRLSEKTWLPLGMVAAVIVSIAIATWRISGQLHAMESAVRDAARDRWTLTDQNDFANQLAVLNGAVTRTDGKAGILIPDPRGIRVRTLESQRSQ